MPSLYYLLSDLLTNGWPAELLIKCLLIAGAIVLGFGLTDIAGWHVGWWTLGGIPSLASNPIAHPFHTGDTNMMASFLDLLIPLALVRIGSTKARFSRLLLGFWLLGALIVQFFTSSRGDGWAPLGLWLPALVCWS